MDFLSYLIKFPITPTDNNDSFSIAYDNSDRNITIGNPFIKMFNINIDDVLQKDDIASIIYLKNKVKNKIQNLGCKTLGRELDEYTVEQMIEYATKNNFNLNCRYQSYIFSQVLISFGFQARWVWCLPYDHLSKECHCVTEVFVKSKQKWIVIDIAFDYLYFDEFGNLLNLYEMRDRLVNGKKIRYISTNHKCSKDTKIYLEKNLFMFRFSCEYKLKTPLKEVDYILLCPEGFSLNKRLYECASYVNNPKLFW